MTNKEIFNNLLKELWEIRCLITWYKSRLKTAPIQAKTDHIIQELNQAKIDQIHVRSLLDSYCIALISLDQLLKELNIQ